MSCQLFCFTQLRASEPRHAFGPRQLPSKPCRPLGNLYSTIRADCRQITAACRQKRHFAPATSPQERGGGMSVDTLCCRFHNSNRQGILWPLEKIRSNTRSKRRFRALCATISRPLQRTADELHHAYADLVAACSSSRPSNALPALLRAQTSAAALAAGLSVLSNFVVALNPREDARSGARTGVVAAVEVEEEEEGSSRTGRRKRSSRIRAGRRRRRGLRIRMG